MTESDKEPISIVDFAVIGAGESGFRDIYKVQPGKVIKCYRIQIRYPSGTNGDLRLALYYGLLKVAPRTPYWFGNDIKITENLDQKYYSGDQVRIWFENVNTTASREYSLVIEAVEC